ncbi:MAG: 30S ribosomal protein S2 [Candidatus Omnitrophica bacterium]|nr:30S ribosomal protein S2 [Candidatus Omnitrophota bacterium]MCF7877130.1 30S ribosomal protein S2 [Candidatus Omnitrophota bacterium]MCF7878729.1 30S ribosomal protein S2 [Candidatus Omnitrophota bacterium]MCF7892796.1 30S ribosomal protein S2 [Candidatus Omnitrophota bacterium]
MGLTNTIKEMLEGGVHFGHLKRNWNPKMKKFIFGRKKNIYIIDLEKTTKKLDQAKEFLKETAKSGGTVLFVGTKRQIRPVIKELSNACDMPYVDQKWVGGLLTNFATIKKRLHRYQELLDMRKNGEFEKIPSKEVVRLNRQISRMDKNYSGLTSLESLPDCVFVVDPKREKACVREAIKLSIPLVALIDTDANPEEIDYPIPGNDDAIRSVKFIVSSLVEAVDEGRQNYHAIKKEEKEAGQEEVKTSEESEADNSQEGKEAKPEETKDKKEEEKKGEESEMRNPKSEKEKEEAKEKKE